MKINWEITLLSLIALFTGIVVYTIWSVYNFAPVQMGIAKALEEVAKQELEKREERERLVQRQEITHKQYGTFAREEVSGGQTYESPVN